MVFGKSINALVGWIERSASPQDFVILNGFFFIGGWFNPNHSTLLQNAVIPPAEAGGSFNSCLPLLAETFANTTGGSRWIVQFQPTIFEHLKMGAEQLQTLNFGL
ncbi:MAG: hypothetical protein IPG76_15320 [Acidobacteria bacterium]|nr:hypothetical protein [Acidobacteriota bacterium]